jgi:hypothetical protein
LIDLDNSGGAYQIETAHADILMAADSIDHIINTKKSSSAQE